MFKTVAGPRCRGECKVVSYLASRLYTFIRGKCSVASCTMQGSLLAGCHGLLGGVCESSRSSDPGVKHFRNTLETIWHIVYTTPSMHRILFLPLIREFSEHKGILYVIWSLL